ncbi:MAG TPA: hypothetical protein VNQ76_07975 [Planctomicrobium sp.]|nr:hypothetical protein [Planctomicrobium sp.]
MLPARGLFVAFLWLTVSVATAADDPIAAKLERARQQYDKSREDIKGKVNQFLDRKQESARKAGNLPLLSVIDEARSQFETAGAIPDDAPTSYYRQACVAHTTLESAYEAAIKSYTQGGQLDEAKRLSDALEVLKNTGLELATKFNQEVQVSARREIGYDLGSISKNDRIRLSYVSGKWKGWGNIASDSPDEPMLEKGDRNRLVVCEADSVGRTRVLAIIPAGTRHVPFELVANRNYERVVLRINDNDNDFASNPDNNVRYHVRVLRGY